jgi:RNA polymerase sigma factor (sigma-70 family)
MEGVIDTLDDAIDMEAAIDTLTERQRDTLALWLLGYTQQEIAEKMGVNQSTVSRRLGRAVHILSAFC